MPPWNPHDGSHSLTHRRRPLLAEVRAGDGETIREAMMASKGGVVAAAAAAPPADSGGGDAPPPRLPPTQQPHITQAVVDAGAFGRYS